MSITIFGFVGSAYSNSIMPVASELYLKDKKIMQRTMNNILTISTIIAMFVIILCWVFPSVFVRIIGADVSVEIFSLAIPLSRIAIVSLLLLIYNGVFSILLRIYDKNIIPTVTELLFPIPILIALYMNISSVYVLVVLIVVGYSIQVVIQFIYLKKQGFKFTPVIDIKDSQLRRIFSLMPPMLLSTGLLQINTIIDIRIASRFGTGSITDLALASKMNGLAYTVFATSLMQIIYASLSKTYAQRDMKKFQSMLEQQTNTILLFILPCALSMLTFSKEIIMFLFVRGNFTQEAGLVTAKILFAYSIGLVFFVLRDICNYAFYSSRNIRLPTIIAGISVVINLVLVITLSNLIGIEGIAYATSISGVCSFILLLISLNIKMENIKLISIYDLMKYLISGMAMQMFMLMMKPKLSNNIQSSFIIMMTGVLVFWFTSYTINFVLKQVSRRRKVY
jgi:putative peptidoglycan lipid II flippase